MPTWEEIKEQGIYKRELEPVHRLSRTSEPTLVPTPLGTPSGKIELFSEQLVPRLPPPGSSPRDEVINPIPVFNPGFQGYGSVTEEYPLYCAGFHHKSRTHSSFGFIPEIEAVARQQVWINPVDAEARSASAR